MDDTTIEQDDRNVQDKYRFDRANVNTLVREMSHISTPRAFLALFTQWAIIATSIALAVSVRTPVVFALALFVIATRQHALAVIIHDAVHYRLCKSRWLNDFVCNLFCAYPLGASTDLYRHFHLDHHRYTNTEKDPEVQLIHSQKDWMFPKPAREIIKIFLKDILGLSFKDGIKYAAVVSPALNYLKPQSQGGISNSERLSYGLFVAAWILAMTRFELWIFYLLFWILPTGMTSAIFRLRMIAEHYGVPNDTEITGTRTITSNMIERMFICPLNVNYHLEHHMFPSVPFFNLPKLRDALLKEEEFSRKAHITKTYLGGIDSVVSELTN